MKVNIPPPKGPEIEKILADIKRLGRFTTDYLKESAKGADIAEAAKIGRERAAKVGEEVAKNWEKGFADGFKNVATMGRSQQRIGLANTAVSQDVNKAEVAWRAGQISDEQMLTFLAKKKEQQTSVYDAAGNLKNMAGGAEQDLLRLEKLDELLAKHEQFTEAMSGEAEGARVLAAELRKAAGALEDEADALDLSIPANEKRKLQLLKQAKEDRTRANAAEKSAEIIEAETNAINKNIAATDGSAEAYEKANKAIDRSTAKALDQKKKLVELGAKQAESDQKQVVAEQQLAEQQERRAAAEEKRARIEEKRQEREAYRDSLLGKKKLELARMLREVNKERAAAVKIGDKEALERLEMQYGALRSAMRSASMAANVNRMMLLQQSQNAQSLAANLDAVVSGFGNLGKAAKDGELNLAGMAGQLSSIFLQLKAGMGPIGWLVLALELIQRKINQVAKANKEEKESEARKVETLRMSQAAYGALTAAHDAYMKKREKDVALGYIKYQQDEINKSLEAGLKLIEGQINAELRLQGLTQNDAQFQRTLKKHELGRALASGKMTQAEYNMALLELDEAAAIESADASVAKARTANNAAAKKYDLILKEDEAQKNRVQEAFDKKDSFKLSEEELNAFDEQEANLKKRREEATEALRLHLKENKLDDSLIGKIIDTGKMFASLATWNMLGDNKADVMKKAEFLRDEMNLASEAHQDFVRAGYEKRGGKTSKEYRREKEIAEAEYQAQSATQKAIQSKRDAAQAEATQAAFNLQETEKNAERAKQQAETIRKEKELDYETTAREEKKAKARQKKINKKLEDLDRKSLEEIDALYTRFSKAKGTNEDSTRWEQYSSALETLDNEYKRRNRVSADNVQMARIEALNDQAAGKGGKGFSALAIDEIYNTWTDFALTPEEVEKLKTEMQKARKAQNETVQQLILTILEEALKTERTEKNVRRQIFNLKRQNAL